MKIDMKKLDKKVTMRQMLMILGAKIESYPVVGECVFYEGKTTPEHDIRSAGNVAIAYEWVGDYTCDRELADIYIGHKFSGPMLSMSKSDDKWVWINLYSLGDYGNNVACGGNWYANSKRTYKTAMEALDYRDYDQDLKKPLTNIYTESELLLSEVKDFVKDFV